MTPVRDITERITKYIDRGDPVMGNSIWIALALCAIAHAIASLRKGPNDYYGQG